MDNSNSKMYINKNGDKIYTNSKGQYHRLDGPAIERKNGNKFWYKKDKRHRLDGPALEWVDGSKYWYKEGLRHRIDGPAIEYLDGDKEWCLLNKNLEEKEFNSWILRIEEFI